jgi:hypothetical protein
LGNELGLKPHALNFALGDVHIYENHYECVRDQLRRPVRFPPQIAINSTPSQQSVQKTDTKDAKNVKDKDDDNNKEGLLRPTTSQIVVNIEHMNRDNIQILNYFPHAKIDGGEVAN